MEFPFPFNFPEKTVCFLYSGNPEKICATRPGHKSAHLNHGWLVASNHKTPQLTFISFNLTDVVVAQARSEA